MRAFLGVILAGLVSTSYALFPRQNGYPRLSSHAQRPLLQLTSLGSMYSKLLGECQN
jgi:hypothetical protein